VVLCNVGVIIVAAAYKKIMRNIGSETSHPKPMVFLGTIQEKFPLDKAVEVEKKVNPLDRVFPPFPVGVICLDSV